MLRSLGCALAAAAAATATGLVVTILTGGSAEDIAGFGVLCFTTSLALALLVYLPVFALTRLARRDRRSVILLTVTLLNAPAYAVLLAGLWRGGLFGGWTEVLMFAGAYGVAGLLFATCASPQSR